jgi:DNA ligase-1
MDNLTEPTTLYKRDAKGALQVWTIHDVLEGILIEWGQEGGSMQTETEEIFEGKQSRTTEEQILSRISSRVEKKLDHGYVRDRNQALTTKAVNRLGLAKPMLAMPLDKVGIRTINLDACLLQFKYDGHRCLIHRASQDEWIAYSRNGKPIPSIIEIMDEIKQLDMPVGFTLDGELYQHGTSLQRITSLVKRRQPGTARLAYVVYDAIPVAPWVFSKRFKLLYQLLFPQNLLNIIIAPTVQCPPRDDIQTALERAINLGYEGLIIRRDSAKYEDGKRSKSLIKVKQFDDDEFIVLDIEPSRVGLGVLLCLTKDGKQFSTPAPGNFQQRELVLIQKQQYIGRHIRVKYAGWTDEGKPFHPIAMGWRDKESE